MAKMHRDETGDRSLSAPEIISKPVAPRDDRNGQLSARSSIVQPAEHRATGKLYSFDPVANDYGQCTATVINSSSAKLIATAAHCVHTGGPSGHMRTKFLFFPGYDEKPADGGTYVGFDVEVMPGWLATDRNADGDAMPAALVDDVAFIAVENNLESKPIVHKVGAFGVQKGTSNAFAATV